MPLTVVFWLLYCLTVWSQVWKSHMTVVCVCVQDIVVFFHELNKLSNIIDNTTQCWECTKKVHKYILSRIFKIKAFNF